MTSLTIVNITIAIGTFVGIMMFNADQTVEWSHIWVLLSTNVFFQLFFISLGMFVSTIIKKVPSVLSLSMGLGIGLYILSSLGKMLSSRTISFISPYAHFAPDYILVEGHYDWSLVWITFIVILISLVFIAG